MGALTADNAVQSQLPLDVEESIEDEELLQKRKAELAARPENAPPEKSTSITAFIHFCRLRSIESDIQQTIYRVDKKRQPAELRKDVDAFMERLAQWKAEMPLDSRALPNFDMLLVDGYHNYVRNEGLFLCPVFGAKADKGPWQDDILLQVHQLPFVPDHSLARNGRQQVLERLC